MNDEQKTTCPVCMSAPVEGWWQGQRKEVNCPACGKFVIYVSLNQWLWDRRKDGTLTAEHKARLRRLSIAIRHSVSPPLITFDNWEQLAAEAPRFTMAAKLRRMLEVVGRKATPGQRFTIPTPEATRLIPEIGAEDVEEVWLLLKNLIARGLLEGKWDSGGLAAASVTVDGWEQLEPLGGGVPGRVFVAMWFDLSMDDTYESGLAKAILDCGLDPRRVDRLDFAGKVCDHILAEIRAAEIVVADFTGFRSGVFFEAGFALGLGKTVIFTCRLDSMADLATHFDTRQYPHIPWSDVADLRAKLADRIRALRSVPRPI